MLPLTLLAAAQGQGPAAAVQAAAARPTALYINILQGEGALNDIRARTAREPIVEVEDQNHKPVAGAVVLFVIDSNGGGGLNATFSGVQALSVTTDASGRAVGRGFTTTHTTGKFHITVEAQDGPVLAQNAVITETNLLHVSSISLVNHLATLAADKPVLFSLADVVVTGAAVGVVVATSPAAPISITAPTGTVGAPTATGVRFEFGRPKR